MSLSPQRLLALAARTQDWWDIRVNSEVSAWQLVGPRLFELVELGHSQELLRESGDILVRRTYGTVCGSDMPRWSGAEFDAFPAAPGYSMHETVGVIVRCGTAEFPEGARVLGMPRDDRGLASHFVTSPSACVVIPDDVPDRLACLAQPLATVLYALERVGNVHTASVSVLGFGVMGHLITLLLAARGCSDITAVDRVQHPDARDWGVTRYVIASAEETARSQSADFDLVIDAIGHSASTIDASVHLARRRGSVLLFGVPAPGATLALDAAFQKNLTVISSVGPPWRAYLERAMGLVPALAARLSGLISETVPFGLADTAYERYAQFQPGRLKVGVSA